jgi:hypothetical protein
VTSLRCHALSIKGGSNQLALQDLPKPESRAYTTESFFHTNNYLGDPIERTHPARLPRLTFHQALGGGETATLT